MDLDTIDAWNFELPTDRIASEPTSERRGSRLLHVTSDGSLIDRQFPELLDQLRAPDVLVFNDTSVLPARLDAKRRSGGRVELLVVGADAESQWSASASVMTAMVRSNRRVRVGEEILLKDDAGEVRLTRGADAEGGLTTFHFEGELFALLDRFGRLPLPPYIEEQRKVRGEAVVQDQDKTRYQSILASVEGAVAAPTASLHFDDAFLAAAQDRGVDIAKVTLHVGIGTFRPIRDERLSAHDMHREVCALDETTAAQLQSARDRGGRIIAVGTTVVRTLESFVQEDGSWNHGKIATDIFIRPGYRFRGTDALLTNFHLPKSTLLALVAAFAGYETTMNAYRHAIAEHYRFFSYGDAMFLEGAPSTFASSE